MDEKSNIKRWRGRAAGWAGALRKARGSLGGWIDLNGALLRSAVWEASSARGEAIARRGSKSELVALAVVVVALRIAGKLAGCIWAGLVAFPCVLVECASIPAGKAKRRRVNASILNLYEAWTDAPSKMGVALFGVMPSWMSACTLWIAATPIAMGRAIVENPLIVPKGLAWRLLGLNPFAMAAAELDSHAEAWERRGLAAGSFGSCVLWWDVERVTGVFEPVGIYGFFSMGIPPWSSPWSHLVSFHDEMGAGAYGRKFAASAAGETWLAMATAQKERSQLAKGIGVVHADAPIRVRRL